MCLVESVLAVAYFNTSYVVIKLSCVWRLLLNNFNFNTSYVVIKLPLRVQVLKALKDFNTSYVVIKQHKYQSYYPEQLISIHLMLLLNIIPMVNSRIIIDISIHLMLLLNPSK